MKARLILILIMASFFIKMDAQNNNHILEGRVVDNGNLPLTYATVALYTGNDSLFSGTITDESGYYIIREIPSGDYFLNISFIGYTGIKRDISINTSLTYPSVALSEGIELDLVTIVANQKLVTSEKGRIVLNVGESKLSQLPSSLDILSFVPGLHISGNNISVIGKGKPLIFINGKEARQEIEVANIQPDMIKKIIVDRNPSAKYDAAYKSIIHITTKETVMKEFSAQLIHSSASNKNYNHSETVNLNYNTNRVKNHLSYKFKNSKNTDKVESYQNIVLNDREENYTYNSKMHEIVPMHNIAFGSNITINEKNSLDIQYFFDHNDQKAKIDGIESITNGNFSTFDVNRYGTSHENNHTVNLGYKLLFEANHSLNIFADYSHKNTDSFEEITSIYESTTKETELDNNATFEIGVLRSEYQRIIGRDYNLSMGMRYSFIRSEGYSHIHTNNQDQNIDNTSLLKESTLSAYTTLSKQYSKVNAELGLRYELNRGEYFKDEVSFYNKHRKLHNVFPTFSVNYDVSGEWQLNFNYTSKIRRPTFYELDPTVSYLSSFLYEQGNPALKPTIEHTIELNTVVKNNLNFSVGFTRTKNVVAYAIVPSENNYLMNSPLNINRSSTFYLNGTYSLSIGAFSSNLVGNISYPFLKYNYNGQEISNNKPHYQFVAINSYSLSPFTFLFCNFIANSKYSYINTVFSPTYSLTIGANFVLFKGKASLMIFGNDLLHKANGNTYSRFGSVESGQYQNLDSRTVGVTLKVNLNRFKNWFKKSDSNESELERIVR